MKIMMQATFLGLDHLSSGVALKKKMMGTKKPIWSELAYDGVDGAARQSDGVPDAGDDQGKQQRGDDDYEGDEHVLPAVHALFEEQFFDGVLVRQHDEGGGGDDCEQNGEVGLQ